MSQDLSMPIFLVGCMRSGTTLLAEMLGTHPNIAYCPFELKEVWSKSGKVPMASPRNKSRDKTCPCLDETAVQRGQRKKLVKGFYKQLNTINDKGDEFFFLNKNPHLCNKIRLVNALFPDARFIFIYRDMPRVVSSLKVKLKKHYWPKENENNKYRCFEYYADYKLPLDFERSRYFPDGNVKYLAEYWFENNSSVSEFSKTIPPNRLLTVKEEDLIMSPETVLAKICSFLNLPIHVPRMMIANFDSKRSNLWKERLDEQEVQILLDYVNELGESLNQIFPGGEDLLGKYRNLLSNRDA